MFKPSDDAVRSSAARTHSDKPRSKSGMTLSLKGRALRYLSAREHSRSELERKLAPHEESPGQLAQVLDDLQAKDFISEQRVADSVVHRKAARFGAARLRYELQSKGLGAQVVTDAVDALKASEFERASLIWRKKFAGPGIDGAARAKQARFLAGRGFSGDVIRRVIARLEED